jgi:hypothetical protein
MCFPKKNEISSQEILALTTSTFYLVEACWDVQKEMMCGINQPVFNQFLKIFKVLPGICTMEVGT